MRESVGERMKNKMKKREREASSLAMVRNPWPLFARLFLLAGLACFLFLFLADIHISAAFLLIRPPSWQALNSQALFWPGQVMLSVLLATNGRRIFQTLRLFPLIIDRETTYPVPFVRYVSLDRPPCAELFTYSRFGRSLGRISSRWVIGVLILF